MKKLIKIIMVLLLSPTICKANIIELNFNDFYSLDAIISLDGKEAALNENNFTSQILLENSPFAGHKNIIVPQINRTLSLDFTFSEGANDNDSFSVYLFDDSLGSFFGLLDSFTFNSSNSGTIEFDLSSYVGKTLGLSFELFDNDFVGGNLNSTINIRHLLLRDTPKTSVPEPNMMLLLIIAFVVMIFNKKHSIQA